MRSLVWSQLNRVKEAGQGTMGSFHALFYLGDLMRREMCMAGQAFFLVLGEDRNPKEHHKRTQNSKTRQYKSTVCGRLK